MRKIGSSVNGISSHFSSRELIIVVLMRVPFTSGLTILDLHEELLVSTQIYQCQRVDDVDVAKRSDARDPSLFLTEATRDCYKLEGVR